MSLQSFVSANLPVWETPKSDYRPYHIFSVSHIVPCVAGQARRAAALYGLPDPLELFEQPWTSKGFSEFAK